MYESLCLPLALSLSLTAQQTNVKTGMASAAKVPVDNVDLKKDARRTVTYTVTGTFTAPHYRSIGLHVVLALAHLCVSARVST